MNRIDGGGEEPEEDGGGGGGGDMVLAVCDLGFDNLVGRGRIRLNDSAGCAVDGGVTWRHRRVNCYFLVRVLKIECLRVDFNAECGIASSTGTRPCALHFYRRYSRDKV